MRSTPESTLPRFLVAVSLVAVSLVAVALAAALPAVALPAVATEAPEAPASFSAPTLKQREIPVEKMAAVDNDALRVEAEEREASSMALPYRFATRLPTRLGSGADGSRETLPSGMQVWRLRISSPSAVNLNLHFSRFDLAAEAKLWIYSPDRQSVHGPYTAADRNRFGELWTPNVQGAELVVELAEPASVAGQSVLEIAAVQHGFRSPLTKDFQGSCNIDSVCPEGGPWQQQIRAAAWYQVLGIDRCSGQLVNNTANDGTPYFLSASHCIQDNLGVQHPEWVPSLVATFNEESASCGDLAGQTSTDTVVGATFRAGDPTTDFLLVELASMPPRNFDPFYAGWDVSGQTPQAAVGIHHPQTEAKALAFEDDPLTTDTEFFSGTHWRVGDWDLGTTEGGSSGSCLYDPSNGLCIGVLTGGFAACPEDFPQRPEDYYGKLSAAWNAGATPDTRLSAWLDPTTSGTTSLGGFDPANGTVCQPSATTMCLNDGRFAVTIDWRDFRDRTGPGRVVNAGTVDSGLFWFFNPNNWEVLVKVLDNCNGPSNRFWVFAAATTNVEYTLTVTDTETDDFKTYRNPLGVSAPAITDTNAFATCP